MFLLRIIIHLIIRSVFGMRNYRFNKEKYQVCVLHVRVLQIYVLQVRGLLIQSTPVQSAKEYPRAGLSPFFLEPDRAPLARLTDFLFALYAPLGSLFTV